MNKLTRRDLPLSGDASARFLPWLIAFMVFLAALTLVGAEALRQTAERWDSGLSGSITVQLPPAVNGSSEERIERAVRLLGEVPEVREIDVLDRGGAAALLEPWLGQAAEDPDLPLPTLITVRTSGDLGEVTEQVRGKLADELPDAEINDHRDWIGGLLDLTRGLELLALFLLILVGAALVVTVVFVTRTGLAVHRPVIELLHLMGARDAQVAGRFQAHALVLGLQGGGLGLLAAIACYLVIDWSVPPATAGLLPPLKMAAHLLVSLTLLPFVAGFVAWATARITVLRTLARMP